MKSRDTGQVKPKCSFVLFPACLPCEISVDRAATSCTRTWLPDIQIGVLIDLRMTYTSAEIADRLSADKEVGQKATFNIGLVSNVRHWTEPDRYSAKSSALDEQAHSEIVDSQSEESKSVHQIVRWTLAPRTVCVCPPEPFPLRQLDRKRTVLFRTGSVAYYVVRILGAQFQRRRSGRLFEAKSFQLSQEMFSTPSKDLRVDVNAQNQQE